jgi:uncharacterized protein Yka (UPF0111/DUF47 family)
MTTMWKKVLGRDEKFFDLLEASADEANSSAVRLKEFLVKIEGAVSVDYLQELILSRRRDKEITTEITRELCRTFVTPIEREDIEALSKSLYKIPKTVQKIAERIMICPRDVIKDGALHHQIRYLEQATEIVVKMVRLLRAGPSLDAVVEMDARLQFIEGEADKLVTRMLQDLYQGTREAREVIILKDVFELLERAIDRCRDAGNTVFQIVLKIS